MIVIVGPTGSGKTEFGIRLAKTINGEIVSADSRQIYKYLSTGTSKPEGTWKLENGKCNYFVDGTAYHLVDFLDPDAVFSAGDFVRMAKDIIGKAVLNKKIPVLVGGTGLYIKSLIDGITKLPPRNEAIRKKLYGMAEKHGNDYLYGQLVKVDREKADTIHPHNLPRIIRALEVYHATGVPISKWYAQEPKEMLCNENTVFIGMFWPRQLLYGHIEKRIRNMLETGMIEETKNLLSSGYAENCPGLQSLGYKYVIQYLKNNITRDEMHKLIFRDTCHYIKRQMTWFRKDNRIKWIDMSSMKNKKEAVEHALKTWKKS